MTQTAAFDEIYSQHVAAVYRASLRAVSRPHVAESITSEAFHELHQAQPTVHRNQTRAWLLADVRRQAAATWLQTTTDPHWSATPLTNPADSLESLLAGCTALTAVHRVCLILRFRHGMSRAEIATRTGLSDLQVKGQLQYALQLLRPPDLFENSASPGAFTFPISSPPSPEPSDA